MTMHPADEKIPYSELLTLYHALEEENAHIRTGLDLVHAERDRYAKMVDILLNMVSPLLENETLPL